MTLRILIRTHARPGSAAPLADERVVETATLRIGSGEDQDLRIADLRLPTAYAELSLIKLGRYRLTFPTGNSTAAPLPGPSRAKPKTKMLRLGRHLDCGRFRLHLVTPPTGYDLLIEQEELRSARDERARRVAGFQQRITPASSGRRGWSWLLFIGILAATLGLPTYLRYGVTHTVHEQILPPALRITVVEVAPKGFMPWISDHVWSPGPISPAHAYFQNDCARCHEQPFVPVRNEACLGCHEKTAQHVDDPKLLAMPAFAQPKCESCHLEHQGAAGMAARQDQRCTLCHAAPKTQFPNTRLDVAADFSANHPVFTPKLARYEKGERKFDWIDAPPDPATAQPVHFLPAPGALKSDTNLRYSHETHLAAGGIRSPTGLKKLDCDSCHVPDGSGVGFRAISMPLHCAECHRLDFDPDDPARVVPHGSEPAVVDTLRDYYGRIALGGGISRADAPAVVQLRRRPGETLSQDTAMAALAWADTRSRLVIDEVFDKRVCTYCHIVQRADMPAAAKNGAGVVHSGNTLVLAPMTFSPWVITPVELPRRRLDQARPFPHARHAAEKCASCHNATESKASEDVMTPPISRCRDCHGDRGSGARIQSVCTDCHGFHLADHALMTVAGKPEELPPDRPRSVSP